MFLKTWIVSNTILKLSLCIFTLYLCLINTTNVNRSPLAGKQSSFLKILILDVNKCDQTGLIFSTDANVQIKCFFL